MRDIAREELIAELRGLRADLARQGITRVALFGSRARRDNRPDSDVDLVVDVDAGRKFSLIDLVGVGHIIEDHLGIEANLFMRRSLDESFQRTVHRDQVPVFEHRTRRLPPNDMRRAIAGVRLSLNGKSFDQANDDPVGWAAFERYLEILSEA